MKTLLLTVLLTISFLSLSDVTTKDLKHEYCVELSKTAGAIMESRQLNTPVSHLLEIINKEKEHKELLKNIIILAYEKPLYKHKKNIKDEINEFTNTIYIICVNNIYED